MRYFSRTLFETVAEENKRQENFLTDLFSMKLGPFSVKGFTVQKFGRGKLFSLEDNKGNPPILWEGNNGNTVFYPIFFGKLKDSNEWAIVF